MDFAGFLIGHGHSDMFLLAFNGQSFLCMVFYYLRFGLS